MPQRKTSRTEDIIAEQCLAVRLRMLNRAVTNIYDDALRPLGVRASQLNILVATARAGTARPADICKRLHLDPSTLSRNVERMKAKGWLKVVDDEDGRAQPFRLTAKGRKLLERVRPIWELAQIEAQELIGQQACVSINDAVTRVRAADSAS